MPPRDKRARVATSVPTGKRAVYARPPEDDGQQRISWRLGDADRNGPYAWNEMGDEWVRRVLDYLADMDKLRWAEAQQGGNPRAKDIPISNLCSDAQRRLEALRKDDQDHLWEFRVGGAERIWGIRYGSICHVLWWDPYHAVCPSSRD